MKVFTLSIILLFSLLGVTTCNQNIPEQVRFEDLVWENPYRYCQTEYGYDKDGDFTFTLENSTETLVVYLVEKEVQWYLGLSRDLGILLDEVKSNMQFLGKTPTFEENDLYSLAFNYRNLQGGARCNFKFMGGYGFCAVILAGDKVFSIVGTNNANPSLKHLEETAYSVHK